MTRPRECEECRAIFYDRPMLQVEVDHEFKIWGYEASASLLDDRLEEVHFDHGGQN